MIVQGRAISSGKVKGKVLKLDETFSFLGGVKASTGDLSVREGNIAGKVFVFTGGKGSTVGSFVMYDLMVHGKAPLAIINKMAETIVTTGAVISSIPMIDMINTDILFEDDEVIVDGDKGTVEITGINMIRVVSSAILCNGKILLLQRPDDAKSFPGRKSLIAGKIELGEDPETAATREIMEETKISVSRPDAHIDPVYVRDKNTIWEVYPFLFKVDNADPILNKENVGFEWVDPEKIPMDPTIVPLTYDVVSEMMKI